jgi:hypothetical protein
MNQILESLNKMKDLQIVRFFSQFFTEEKLGPLLKSFTGDGNGPGSGVVTKLVVWAIVLAVGTFVIDQVFFWTSPGQVERAKTNWKNFTLSMSNLSASAQVLYERAKGLIGKREGLTNGRR